MISFEPPESILKTVAMIEAVATEMMRPQARYYDEHEHEIPWDYINFMQAAVASGGGVSMVPNASNGDGKPIVDEATGDGSMVNEATGDGSMVNEATIGYQSMAHFIEMLSWGDAGLYLCTPRAGLGAAAVAEAGTPEQKAKFLKRFNGEKAVFSAMAITEPHAGSDTAAIKSTAVRDGDEWVLNGEKIFVTGGHKSLVDTPGFVIVWATIDPEAGRKGIRSFVVEADTPGCTVTKLEKKLGIRSSDTASIVLQDCRVPFENMLGTVEHKKKTTEGYKGVLLTFEVTRPLVSASALGIARAALEFLKEELAEGGVEIRYGFPRNRMTNLEAEIIDLEAMLRSAWLLTLRAVWMVDNQLPINAESSMSKVKAGDAVVKITQKAVELLGPMGYSREHLLEKWFRDAKINDLYVGTGQINRLIVARRILNYGRQGVELERQEFMTYKIEQAAVIGAGTMGAAIAAHLANAGVSSLLLDVVPTELTPDEQARGLSLEDKAVKNRIVREGWERCRAARPANLFSDRRADLVNLGNLEDDLDHIAESDWIIEAVVERLDIKHEILSRIEAVRRPDSIVSTNTSGLPIHKIAEGRNEDFKAHFLGTHFFNPPRYLKLLEVIPLEQTKPEILEAIAKFANERLGKGVIVCKDTPNFIGNRYFSIMNSYTLDYALENGYTVEEVDRLTGPIIGSPKTATYRLLDLVGIDIIGHVGEHLYPALEGDGFREVLQSPRIQAMVEGLVERGWLGRKTGQGFYSRAEDGVFWWLDTDSMEYHPPAKPKFESIGKHKDHEDIGERLKLILAEEDRAAQFLWATTSFGFRYAASMIPSVSDNIRDVDNAMKWGFKHELGPFERWDALGVAESVARMEEEGETVADWVMKMLEAGVASFYQQQNSLVIGTYDSASQSYIPIPADPRVISILDLKAQGKEFDANDGASLLDMGEGVLLLEFHTPASTALDADVLQMAGIALEELNKEEWKAMVVGNQGKHFSVGANIFTMAVAAQQGDMDLIDEAGRALQTVLQRMRASRKPVVVAPFGMALGGGAEVIMGGSRVVAAAESYIGLVEAGVGLIPAGSGTKELMRRRLGPVMRTENADVLPHLLAIFEQIALAKVAESAEQARDMGFLSSDDRIIMNQDHLLAEAKRTALQMAEAGYQPPEDGQVWAAGRDALADLNMLVWSMVDAGYATEHDGVVSNQLARVLTGGDISGPGWVPDEYILELEREAFVALAAEEKTQERMWYMLQNRKPLRN